MIEAVSSQCLNKYASYYVHLSIQTLCPQQPRTQHIVQSVFCNNLSRMLASLTNFVVCRTEQLRTAMAQWQNKAISAAFSCWRDHVVTKTSHSAKVC